MPGIIKKLMSFRNFFNRREPESESGEIVEEKWVADFSKEKHARFYIKSEDAYDAKLRKNLFYSGHSLVLSLKKTGCIAWVEAPERRYGDLVISGAVRIDAAGGYAAGGMIFRMVDGGSYYSFLVSSKGYFRLDALRNGMPFPLIGWTELPLSAGTAPGPDHAVDFSLIAYGSHIVILIRGRWAAEINDSSVFEGTNCFAAVSYESGTPALKSPGGEAAVYSAEVFLESLSVESRIAEVAAVYEKWRDSPDIDPKARVYLAETFAAMNQHNAVLVQLRKAWDTPGHRKSQGELLLAGRAARALGLMADAESYIGQCFQADVESSEGRAAIAEMAGILYRGERFDELRDYCGEAIKIKGDDPVLWTLQGHAFWNRKEYKKAAASYDRAFELDGGNGIPAKNAANVYDVMGRKKEALARYLEAGRAFLKAGNYNDLGLVVPMILSLGGDNWEARSLAGKWAFAVEDWGMAEAEFRRAGELRKAKRPKPRNDGALVFLEALLLVRAGKRGEALPLFAEAAALEKSYALFRFRLAENLFLLDDDPADPRMLAELNAALTLLEEDSPGEKITGIKENGDLAGWVNNFAAQVALRKGDLDAAAKYLEKAAGLLGDSPDVRVNRAVLFYLRGSLDKALEILDGDKRDDPGGVMANCAGNLLVRGGRFEEADEKYRRALAAAPDNAEYLGNRASCLIELSLYGEADELLARAHTLAPGPGLLEMISFVAVRKGEYPRAEQACRSALEMDPGHAPSLLSLGWILFSTGRRQEAREILKTLDALKLGEDTAKGREELRARLDDLVYQTIGCASCDRVWKIPKDPPPAPAIRLFAMPPDNLPAGSCPGCGKTWCIGCAQKNLDSSGRFVCPACGRSLKLANEGLKKIIHDWALTDGLVKTDKSAGEKRRRGRPAKAANETPDPAPVKRGRGRPPKTSGTAPGSDRQGKKRNPEAAESFSPEPVKRGRGRPAKAVSETPDPAPVKRGRGRPSK